MRQAASAQNMNASSASGLWARRMAGAASATTRLPSATGGRGRLRMEAVEVLDVVAVLRPLTRPLGGLVQQEFAIRAERARRIVAQLQRPRPQHEAEEMGGCRPLDRIGLGERGGGIPSRQRERSGVGGGVYVGRPRHSVVRQG